MHCPHRPAGAHVAARGSTSWRRAVGAALAVSLLAIAPASASAQLPPQGLYEACYPGDALGFGACDARVQQIGAAGFRLVLNYWMLAESTPQQILDYVHAAAASGVETIWPFSDWWQSNPNNSNLLLSYPLLAASCGCTTNAGLLAYVVRMAKSQPGTWGYYAADEPDPSKVSQLKAFVAEIKAIDPVHPVLIVSGAGSMPTFAGTGDVLAGDTYPVGSGPINDPGVATAEASATQQVQQLSQSAGVKSAMVLQAWNWDDELDCRGLWSGVTHFPTTAEMTMMRNAALENGHLSMILWWSMFDLEGYVPVEQPSYFLAPPDPATRWSSLVQAAFAPAPVAPAPPSTATPSVANVTPVPSSSGAQALTTSDPLAVAANGRPQVRLALRLHGTRRGDIVHADGWSPGQRLVSYRWSVGARKMPGCRATCAFRWSGRSTVAVRLVVTDSHGDSGSAERVLRRSR
jgi:hypothetical protein